MIGIVLQYVLSRGELSDESAFFDLVNANISHETGEMMMSLAEKWELRRELKGKLEIAQNMIEEGADVAFIMKMTRLPLETINELKKKHDAI